jgi:hypothetical protein
MIDPFRFLDPTARVATGERQIAGAFRRKGSGGGPDRETASPTVQIPRRSDDDDDQAASW